MSTIVEIRDPYTAGHQRRVAQLACAIARELKLSESDLEGIYVAAIIHDLGKISVPAEILCKPVKLSQSEFDLMKNHPQVGFDILQAVEFPWPVASIVLQHHERLNGSGYPRGLSSEQILLESKILMVADVVEAMSADRPYRLALNIETVMEEIRKNSGILYEIEMVTACERLFKEKGFHFT